MRTWWVIGMVCIWCVRPVFSHPHVIGFSIHESKIVNTIPDKTQDFATVIPGNLNTYVFDSEPDYYKDYQKSYFAVTRSKGGWDCMRHYEILANGCVPYFLDLEKCDSETMFFLPRDLILEAMNLPGVSLGQIDHNIFDRERYFAILKKLLAYTKRYLTNRAMASHLLKEMNYSGEGQVLFLSKDVTPDYMRCTILAGLKDVLGDKVVDYPKIPHIYKNYAGDVKQLYGKGFSYTKVVDDFTVDRRLSTIRLMLTRRKYELVIYGSVHRGMLLHNLILSTYDPDKVAYICGEDFHTCPYFHLPRLFLREFSLNRE